MNNPKLDEVVYYLMEKALKASRKQSIQVFKDAGLPITIDQWVLLRRIYEETSQTQVDLARATMKDTASITRILDLLHEKGLVRRVPNPRDKRKSALVLTSKGKTITEMAYPVVARLRAQGVADITPEELQITKQVLNRIAQNMKPDSE